jgi:methionyl-tRNA synthetase
VNRAPSARGVGTALIVKHELRRLPNAADSFDEGGEPMAETITIDQFAQLDLRTAKVLEARPHPNADKLVLLQIDVGDAHKQIVAGIRGHYSLEELVGRTIIVVNNLQPAKLRGEESNGMLLAATTDDKVVLLRPDVDLPPGCKVR